MCRGSSRGIDHELQPSKERYSSVSKGQTLDKSCYIVPTLGVHRTNQEVRGGIYYYMAGYDVEVGELRWCASKCAYTSTSSRADNP